MAQSRREISARYYQNHKAERNERVRQWKKDNPERAREYARKKHLRRFNLTPEAYDALLDAQGGVCAICGLPCSTGKSLSVDHDHECCEAKGVSCGKCIRGLLCSTCNRGVGLFGDDPGALRLAATYLEDRRGRGNL